MKSESLKFAFAWSPIEGAQMLQFGTKCDIGGITLYTIPIATRPKTGSPILLRSFAATPGRYIEALYGQITKLNPREDRVIFLNPSFLPSERSLDARLLAIKDAIKRIRRKQADDLVIWTTGKTPRALAYEISLSAFKADPQAVFALRNFSTFDNKTDLKIFSGLCGLSSSSSSVDLYLEDKIVMTPGFLDAGTESVLVHQANHLLTALSVHDRSKAIEDPLYVMPYEAGDLLFFSLALKERGILNPSILTLDRFAPIVKRVLPDARLFRLPTKISETERKRMPELEFVKKFILSAIPHFRSFIYLRPYRSVWPTQSHLIDQFRFALGFDFNDEKSVASIDAFSLTEPRKDALNARPRVLCHFEGGWKLKHYPLKWQAELIGMLKKEGFRVTVLSDSKFPNTPSTPFTSLSEFESLLNRTDLVIGVDSFPAHYASLAAGIPTMTLFGSTRPSCGHLPRPGAAISSERGLDCNPCGQISECPRYFGNICLNYSEPETVLGELRLLVGLSDSPALEETI